MQRDGSLQADDTVLAVVPQEQGMKMPPVAGHALRRMLNVAHDPEREARGTGIGMTDKAQGDEERRYVEFQYRIRIVIGQG